MPHATSSPPRTASPDMSSPPPQALTNKVPILMVGLPSDHPSLVGVKPAHEVAAGLAMVQKKFDASPIYSLTQHLCAPEDSLDPYIAVLRSQQWRGVCIGFGVRSSMNLTQFFEQLVRLAQIHAPQARFCFNAGLPDTYASVERNVPVTDTDVEQASAEKTKTEKDAGHGETRERKKSVDKSLGRSASKSEKRKNWDWRRVLR